MNYRNISTNAKEIEAIAKLSKDNKFLVVVEMFERILDEQDDDNRRLDGNDVYRGQGMSLAYAGILKLIEDAPAAYDAARK